jgi:hypothetical protein
MGFSFDPPENSECRLWILDFGTDPDADLDPRISTFDLRILLRILPFSSVTFKTLTKNSFNKSLYASYSFLKVQLHHSSNIKSHQE